MSWVVIYQSVWLVKGYISWYLWSSECGVELSLVSMQDKITLHACIRRFPEKTVFLIGMSYGLERVRAKAGSLQLFKFESSIVQVWVFCTSLQLFKFDLVYQDSLDHRSCRTFIHMIRKPFWIFWHVQWLASGRDFHTEQSSHTWASSIISKTFSARILLSPPR